MHDISMEHNDYIVKEVLNATWRGANYSIVQALTDGRVKPPPASNIEVALLIVVATIGMIGNFGIMVSILVLTSLRRASNAFLFHQCLLDFTKSAYCLPFAHTMVRERSPLFCSLLGASYVVLVTTSSFNLLAVVMNEVYQFTDLTLGIKDSRNYCCVAFGVFIIWFTSIIMNLGVAFIPGSPTFDREIGHCIFIYGITRSYVLHMLWIVLVTMAIGLTANYLRKLYLDIKRSSYYRMTTLVRATIAIDTKSRTASQRRQSQIKEKHHVKKVQQVTRTKLYLLILLLVLHVLFLYPLFVLSAVDPTFHVSNQIYKALTLFSWSHAAITPLILFFFIKTACCCQGEDMTTLLDDTIEEDISGPSHQCQGEDHCPSRQDGQAIQADPRSEEIHEILEGQDMLRNDQDQRVRTGYSTSSSPAPSTSTSTRRTQEKIDKKKGKKGKAVSLWI